MTPAKRNTLPKTARKIPLDFSLTTVNIVLLLIFFFLVSGSLIETEELSVDLAETSELPLDRLPRPLLLMDVGDKLQLNGDPVTEDTLRAALSPLLNKDRPRLHILADRDVPAGALVSLIQRGDLQGIEIKLVTLRQHTPKS
ncbi:ExbD/TolR family protein [Litoreibacter albidus]|uniref:Biopolymer transport protein ExbD n=1 Tax=Litoreibacter albidus TaxID=670155 RepID=A0A1H3DAN9_9RHOB|nr:biopolymer transporter ExbD [Litoreibacter albidus]SDX63426.1 Biopolymer transport protein ExbD [Litoreibacter albidus]